MIKMVNLQSREHSLVYCYVWQVANQTQTRGWFKPVKNILFVNNGINKKTRVWYDEKEWEGIFTNTGKRAMEEKGFFEKASKESLALTEEMVLYFDGKKMIESLRDWKAFYDLWIKWWAPMAIIYTLPESKTASKQIQEQALEIRAKIEKYSDLCDEFAMTHLCKNYPQYKEIVGLMTPDEIVRLDKHSPAELENIKTREHGYVLYNGQLFARGELDRVLAENDLELNEPKIISRSEVKGAPASLGIAIGKVVVVYGKKDLARIDAESVLVTEMTSPDYVPYMKIAKAVVTDEGGINCHAAIVAREMKKPCIIGTKIATKVFKDGDMVEVDAEKGIVKIIK